MTQKDTSGQNNIEKYAVMANSTNLSVNPFGQNKAADIAYKKAERLVIATHLVTNFVPKSESVRENTRERAQQLLPKVLEVRDGFDSSGSDRIVAIVAHVRHILSLLDILHAAGYVSDMNVEVLKNAYADFARFLVHAQGGTTSEDVVLDDDYFATYVTDNQGHESKGHVRNVKDTSVRDSVKDTEVKVSVKDTQKRLQSVKTQRKVKSRRMAILDVVSKNNPVHIKDIAAEVTDCSEKTIQRELASLVADGVIKKEGSKRWTVYSLVV